MRIHRTDPTRHGVACARLPPLCCVTRAPIRRYTAGSTRMHPTTGCDTDSGNALTTPCVGRPSRGCGVQFPTCFHAPRVPTLPPHKSGQVRAERRDGETSASDTRGPKTDEKGRTHLRFLPASFEISRKRRAGDTVRESDPEQGRGRRERKKQGERSGVMRGGAGGGARRRVQRAMAYEAPCKRGPAAGEPRKEARASDESMRHWSVWIRMQMAQQTALVNPSPDRHVTSLNYLYLENSYYLRQDSEHQ
ncbi:hypothetical protein FB451DRAFT_1182968 [Mycena latifolia]|nr:hypothetical protein FB451DRAFT_1182968 [Mycena latifolia]